MKTFFCYTCRKHKNVSLLIPRNGKKNMCQHCVTIAENNAKQKNQDSSLQEAKRKSKNYSSGKFVIKDY